MAPHEPWTDFICEKTGFSCVLDLFLRKNRNCPGQLSEFYKSLYKEWQAVYNVIPITDMSCRSEPLWNNSNISLRSLARLDGEWRELGIRRINDILHMGRMMSVREFRNHHGIFVQQLTLDKIEKHIGRDTLSLILPMDKRVNPVGLYIAGVDGRLLDLGNMSTKELYQVLMKGKNPRVAAKASWIREFEDYDGVDSDLQWAYWYKVPYLISREVRLQSFQFKVLHRTIPCNVYLQRIRIRDTKTCSYCDEWDDLVHFFYYCPATMAFWDSVALWLNANSNTVIFPQDIEEPDFLFGLKGHAEDERRVNLILLYGRFYVYKQKIFGNGELDAYRFLVEFKNLLLVEKLACIQEGTRRRKFALWKEFYEEL